MFYLFLFILIWILHAVSGFLSRVLCAANLCIDLPSSVFVTKAPESAIVVNRNTPVVCFSTSCLWPLWRVSLLSVLRRGEINTFNVMCGQWNKGMIYVGMAKSDGICVLVAGWAEGRRGGGTTTQRKKNYKRFLKKCASLLLIVGTTPLSTAPLLYFHLSNTPCSLTVPLNLSAVVLWD